MQKKKKKKIDAGTTMVATLKFLKINNKKQWKTKINLHYYVETINVRILEKRKKDKTK